MKRLARGIGLGAAGLACFVVPIVFIVKALGLHFDQSAHGAWVMLLYLILLANMIWLAEKARLN